MRFEYWMIIVAALGGIGNLWVVHDCRKINIEGAEFHYVFVAVAAWVIAMMLIKVIWL
jgi:hypothetical protein